MTHSMTATHTSPWITSVAAEQKYDRGGGGGGAGVRGREAADYLHKASACKDQKLRRLKPP